MQVLFRLRGLRWDTLFTLCFIFMTEKENNFQTDQNIALLHLKSKEKSLIYLNSHRYFLFYCLYYLNISRQKIKCLLMSPHAAVVWSRHAAHNAFTYLGKCNATRKPERKTGLHCHAIWSGLRYNPSKRE